MEIQGKPILVWVSEGSGYRESTVCCENLTLNFLYTVNRTFFWQVGENPGSKVAYKPWTVGPNGFMGKTLLTLQISSSFQKRLHYWCFSWGCISKKGQTVPSFLADKPTTSPGQGTSEIFTVKEHSHIANTHLKIMRIGPKGFLGRHKKTTAYL